MNLEESFKETNLGWEEGHIPGCIVMSPCRTIALMDSTIDLKVRNDRYIKASIEAAERSRDSYKKTHDELEGEYVWDVELEALYKAMEKSVTYIKVKQTFAKNKKRLFAWNATSGWGFKEIILLNVINSFPNSACEIYIPNIPVPGYARRVGEEDQMIIFAPFVSSDRDEKWNVFEEETQMTFEEDDDLW